MKPQTTRGIILRRIDYGEADRIITMLTDENGKIRLMAKGVRKAKSKLAGGIELFSVSELQFIKGRSSIGTLVSTRLSVNYGNIVKDLGRTELAYNMLKTIDKILEDDTGQDYFDILNDSLRSLNSPLVPLVVTELSFGMRLMSRMGHAPDFTTDVSGNKLDPDSKYEFDFEHTAFKAVPDGPFDKNHLKVLKLLAYNSPDKIVAVQGIEGYCNDLASLIRGLNSQYLV